MRMRFLLLIVCAVVNVYLGEPLMETAVFWTQVEKEAFYFPVGKDISGGKEVSFEDSYGQARTFGGDRQHEGCDIMAGENKAGYYPIFSMTEGVVENIGWLTLGGYRIGIRSSGGIYYYYAHLDSYADGLSQGSPVTAGQFLGFMGDSGYGEEGTTGKFPVHLHLGIYTGEEEQSQNPYRILKRLWNKQIAFLPVSMVK